jgi:predicted transcriptional regulator of viral defense system
MNLKSDGRQTSRGHLDKRVLDVLSRSGKPVIRAHDLEKILDLSRAASNLILSRLCNKGWIQRLYSGAYRIIPLGSDSTNPIPEDAWAIATELLSPCYVSGWTAAEHWELTEQIFNSTVVFTAKKQRKKEFTISGLKYITKSIATENIFGVEKIWSSNVPIKIADIHRTIIDILDDPEIGGGGRQVVDIFKEYCQRKEANPEMLCEYAETLGHGAVFKRLGFIGEKLAKFPQHLLLRLHSNIKTGVIKFDPTGPNSGPIIAKWGIRINIPLGDMT